MQKELRDRVEGILEMFGKEKCDSRNAYETLAALQNEFGSQSILVLLEAMINVTKHPITNAFEYAFEYAFADSLVKTMEGLLLSPAKDWPNSGNLLSAMENYHLVVCARRQMA